LKKKNKKRSLKTKKKSRQPEKNSPKINCKKKLLVLFICAILVLLSVFSVWKYITPGDLESKEIIAIYDGDVPIHLKTAILNNFVESVNSLPDRQSRTSLISVLKNGQIPVRFCNIAADMKFDNQLVEIQVNYQLILPGVLPKEVIWSTLTHENVHIVNYLSGLVKPRLFQECREQGIGKKCAFEYFLDEYKGMSKQLEFLMGINSMHLAPLPIRELFVADDIKNSVLAILRIRYVEKGFVHPYYAQYYPEFERLMLQDEKLVYAVIGK